MSPEPALQILHSFDDIDEITVPNLDPFTTDQVSGIIHNGLEVPYLDTGTSNGGGVAKLWQAISSKIRLSLLCGRHAVKGFGAETGCRYFNFISCRKWWCEYCGKIGGVIHKRKMARLIEIIGEDLNKILLRQFVFTVPSDVAEEFGSRKALNSLIKMAEKIIKKRYPGLKCFVYLHLFGDHGALRLHPHVNIHVSDKKGELKMLPLETLTEIQEAWRFALQAWLHRSVKVADVHYSFATEPGKIKHRIKYMSRPCPGPKEYLRLKKDIPLLYFCVVVLSGFIFIRYFNGCRSKGVKDTSRKEELKGIVGIAGEKIIWDFFDTISKAEFDFIYKPEDYAQLTLSLYRIRGP